MIGLEVPCGRGCGQDVCLPALKCEACAQRDGSMVIMVPCGLVGLIARYLMPEGSQLALGTRQEYVAVVKEQGLFLMSWSVM